MNDRFGHDEGDQLLREVAAHMRASLRQDDELFRLGGDEFVVLCAPSCLPLANLGLAERLKKVVAEGVPARLRQVGVTASIGVASAPAVDAGILLRMADSAMYEAKRSGGDAVAVHGRVCDLHAVSSAPHAGHRTTEPDR